MTTERNSFLMILLPNGQVLAAGGGQLTSAGTWTATGCMISGGGAGVLLQNGDVFALTELYSPTTGTWASTARDPIGVGLPIAPLPTGDVFAGGGIQAETNGIASLLDPSTLTWASTGNMTVSRVGETVTVLLNGEVLFAGGETLKRAGGLLSPL